MVDLPPLCWYTNTSWKWHTCGSSNERGIREKLYDHFTK